MLLYGRDIRSAGRRGVKLVSNRKTSRIGVKSVPVVNNIQLSWKSWLLWSSRCVEVKSSTQPSRRLNFWCGEVDDFSTPLDSSPSLVLRYCLASAARSHIFIFLSRPTILVSIYYLHKQLWGVTVYSAVFRWIIHIINVELEEEVFF